jgi:predicted dinucleotide-binding enzyme
MTSKMREMKTDSAQGSTMTTAIVGVGNIGSTLARHLVAGGESVILAAKDPSRAQELAEGLGPLASAASVEEAIGAADAVVFAVWLDTMGELIPPYTRLLKDKVVIDPSNPIGFDASGQMMRTLPDGESAGSVVAALLPPGAHYVKAFGTLGADALAASAHRDPLAVLFYATDGASAAATVERLIRVAGFEPWKAGGLAAAGRIEAPGGDLHQYGFNGDVVDIDRAKAATAGTAA